VSNDLAVDGPLRQRLDDAIGLLFESVSEGVGWATSALLDQDFERAHRVIDGDQIVDQQCERVIQLVKERLAEETLEAEELDVLIAILQIVPELERSADLASHIAERSIRGLGGRITPLSRGLIHSISELTIGMWQQVGRAYSERSRDASFGLNEADNELDELCASLVGEGVSEHDDARVAVDLALIARFYERLGDHAVNLSRRIADMAAPKRLSGFDAAQKPKPDRASKGPRAARIGAAIRRFRLVPRDERFFDLFDQAALNARDCARELMKITASFSDLDDHFDQMKSFERRGDEITIQLLHLLDATFVTPYDREDIHALVEVIDDVVDDMFAAASLIQLVQVDTPLVDVPEMAEILGTMADEMAALLSCLRSKSGARYRLERIEQLEHQGDAVYRRAIARLFSGDFDAIEILKWKDIVRSFEDAMNAIEDVSDVVESILIKDS
jgi:predicted phosphate transport protein (TIGR00153 family)